MSGKSIGACAIIVWELFRGETTSGLYAWPSGVILNTFFYGFKALHSYQVGRVTVRLNSNPVLVREVPNHIRRQNVAIVVPRMTRHRLGDASRAKVVWCLGDGTVKKDPHCTETWVNSMTPTYSTGVLEREHPDHCVVLPSVMWAYRPESKAP